MSGQAASVRGPAVGALPLSLYVHLPWCLSKCPYCDFNSHALAGTLPEREYVDALLADLGYEAALAGGRELASVYFGGGTPSLFSPPALGRLMTGIGSRVALRAGAEVTLEVNPGSYRDGYFAALREVGINRLSIGVQSFDDRQLKALGRVHDAAAARRTVTAARAAGFDTFNVDLMFGLPGQDARGALDDVAAALALGPDHLSHYQLTIEPGTRFGARPPVLPPEEAIAEAQAACHALLAEHGFVHYEVSAFARAGRESRHNLNYWQFGDYLGIGAGAHGKSSGAWGVERRSRVRAPRTYLATAGSAAAVAEVSRPAGEALALEFLLNALRLREGFTVELFASRTGMPWEALGARVARTAARGLLECDDGRVRATARGWELLDTLLLELACD